MKKIYKMSVRQLYEPAMKIKTQIEADEYFEWLVERHLRRCDEPCSKEQAESIERHNLGHYAGYYDAETRERVERLFQCSHSTQERQPTQE